MFHAAATPVAGQEGILRFPENPPSRLGTSITYSILGAEITEVWDEIVEPAHQGLYHREFQRKSHGVRTGSERVVLNGVIRAQHVATVREIAISLDCGPIRDRIVEEGLVLSTLEYPFELSVSCPTNEPFTIFIGVWLFHAEDDREGFRISGTLSPDFDSAPAPTPGILAPCKAVIDLPAGLKPGEVLSPSYTITAADGRPPHGDVYPVLYINGRQANSVVWDGKEAKIELQVSCQGHALSVSAIMPAYGSPPPPADTPPPGGHDSVPDGLSKIPLPENASQAMAGIVIPGIISVILGILGQSGATAAPSGVPGSSAAKAGSAQALQGEEALEWLERNGMVRKVDGRYVKTGDWNNATAPGTGMRGFVESSQSDSSAVDSDIVILVDIPGAPSTPDDYEFPRESSIEIPEEPDYTGADYVETEEAESKVSTDREPEFEQETVEEAELKSKEGSEPGADNGQPDADGSHADGGTGEPEAGETAVEDPGGHAQPEEIAEPADDAGTLEADNKGVSADSPEAAGNGEAGNADSESSSEPTTEASPEASQRGAARPVQEAIERGRDQAGRAAEGLKEAESSVKAVRERLGEWKGHTGEVRDILEALPIHGDSKNRALGYFNELDKALGEMDDGLKRLEGLAKDARGYADGVRQVLERGERVIAAYNDMSENLPDGIHPGLEAGLSTYAAAFTATGEVLDRYVRSLPYGDTLADAFQTRDFGPEACRAIVRTVEILNTSNQYLRDEFVTPIENKFGDASFDPNQLTQDQQDYYREITGRTVEQGHQEFRKQGLIQMEKDELESSLQYAEEFVKNGRHPGEYLTSEGVSCPEVELLKEHAPERLQRALEIHRNRRRGMECDEGGPFGQPVRGIRNRLREGGPPYTEYELEAIEQTLGRDQADWLRRQQEAWLRGEKLQDKPAVTRPGVTSQPNWFNDHPRSM